MTGLKIMRVHGDTLVSPAQYMRWPIARAETFGPPQPAESGIHAYHDLAALQADAITDCQSSDRAIVEVSPDGEIVIGEHGWVAQAATITRIWVPRALYLGCYAALHDRYRVPVEVIRWPWARAPRPTPLDLSAQREWFRAHVGEEYARTHLPAVVYDVAYRDDHAGRCNGHLRQDIADARDRLLHPAAYDYRGVRTSLILWASPQAALSRELHAAHAAVREEKQRRRAREAQQARDSLALHIRAHGPIPCVRVSSAKTHASYSYWGAVRYRVELTRDGDPTYRAEERASSDRRSVAGAERDAKALAQRTGRHHLQADPGRLSDGACIQILRILREVEHA